MDRELNFHQLLVFCTVVRAGGFAKAGTELSISQPAVSIQVRELENQLGTPLLHRGRRGIALTDAGKAVYDYAQRIFSIAKELRETVEDIRGLKAGRLTIGASTTPGEYLLPLAIGGFKEQYPGIDVSLTISNSATIIQEIRRGELDMGMIGMDVIDEAFTCTPYLTDEIVVIASPKHTLTRNPSIALEELRGQPFVLREQGSATRKTAEECLKSMKIDIKVAMELGSNEAVKKAVAAGLGLGVISRFGLDTELAAGHLCVLPVQGWLCHRPINVLYRKDKHLTWAQRAFLELLQKENPVPKG